MRDKPIRVSIDECFLGFHVGRSFVHEFVPDVPPSQGNVGVVVLHGDFNHSAQRVWGECARKWLSEDHR